MIPYVNYSLKCIKSKVRGRCMVCMCVDVDITRKIYTICVKRVLFKNYNIQYNPFLFSALFCKRSA